MCARVVYGVVGIDANEQSSLSIYYVYAIAMHIQYRVLSITIPFSACLSMYLFNAHCSVNIRINAYRFAIYLLQFTRIFLE